MILKRQNMSENKWNHFKIVPLLTQSLSTVNCQLSIKYQCHYLNKAGCVSFYPTTVTSPETDALKASSMDWVVTWSEKLLPTMKNMAMSPQ